MSPSPSSLQRGHSTQNEGVATAFTFSKVCCELLEKISGNSLKSSGEDATMILHELIQSGAISDSTTYQEVNNNHSLKRALLLKLHSGLPHDIDSSALMGEELKRHKKALKSKVERCRDTLIKKFALVGTGDQMKTPKTQTEHGFASNKLAQHRKYDEKNNLGTLAHLLPNIQQLEACLSVVKTCYYCSTEISYKPQKFSLDRVDNSKSHEITNLLFSCLSCNLKRGNNYGATEFKLVTDLHSLIRDASALWPQCKPQKKELSSHLMSEILEREDVKNKLVVLKTAKCVKMVENIGSETLVEGLPSAVMVETNAAAVLTRSQAWRKNPHGFAGNMLNNNRTKDKNKGRKSNDELLPNIQQLEACLSVVKTCCYCSTEISYEPQKFSLDRVDNSKSHEITNLLFSCLSCNLKRKNSFSATEFKLVTDLHSLISDASALWPQCKPQKKELSSHLMSEILETEDVKDKLVVLRRIERKRKVSG